MWSSLPTQTSPTPPPKKHLFWVKKNMNHACDARLSLTDLTLRVWLPYQLLALWAPSSKLQSRVMHLRGIQRPRFPGETTHLGSDTVLVCDYTLCATHKTNARHVHWFFHGWLHQSSTLFFFFITPTTTSTNPEQRGNKPTQMDERVKNGPGSEHNTWLSLNLYISIPTKQVCEPSASGLIDKLGGLWEEDNRQ